MPSWLGWTLTFMFVSLSWVPFRAASLEGAVKVYASLLGLGTQQTYEWFPSWLPICLVAVVLAHLATLWLTDPARVQGRNVGSRLLMILGITPTERQFAGTYLVPVRITMLGTYVFVLFLVSIFLFAPPSVGPFVYAAF